MLTFFYVCLAVWRYDTFYLSTLLCLDGENAFFKRGGFEIILASCKIIQDLFEGCYCNSGARQCYSIWFDMLNGCF